MTTYSNLFSFRHKQKITRLKKDSQSNVVTHGHIKIIIIITLFKVTVFIEMLSKKLVFHVEFSLL